MQIYSLQDLEQEFSLCKKIYPGSKPAEPLLKILWQAGLDSQRAGAEGNLSGAPAAEVVKLAQSICGLVAELSPDHKPRLEQIAMLLEEGINTRAEEDMIKPDSLVDLYQELCRDLEEQDFLSMVLTTISSAFFSAQGPVEESTTVQAVSDMAVCPSCGQKPHYAYYDSDSGSKLLTCWLCSTQWRFPRLKCPYCSNTDPDSLGYFTLEGMEACQVHYCSSCSCYHKVFDLRQFDQSVPPVLFIHQLASLLCDSIAHREGFVAGSGLTWIDNSEMHSTHD